MLIKSSDDGSAPWQLKKCVDFQVGFRKSSGQLQAANYSSSGKTLGGNRSGLRYLGGQSFSGPGDGVLIVIPTHSSRVPHTSRTLRCVGFCPAAEHEST